MKALFDLVKERTHPWIADAMVWSVALGLIAIGLLAILALAEKAWSQ